jgi:ankyrin repeat domain-containing protein 50
MSRFLNISQLTFDSATALQELLSSAHNHCNQVVAYFYFDFNDSEKQSPQKAIRSIVQQVVRQSRCATDLLEQLYERHGKGLHQPSDQSIVALLREVLELQDTSFLVLDALDECNEREKFLKIFCEIIKLELPGLHVIATSRLEQDIGEYLRPLAYLVINIEGAAVDEDIRTYISSQLTTDRRLKKLTKYHDDILDTMMRKAGGM